MMTFEQLGITEKEYDGLQLIRDAFRDGVFDGHFDMESTGANIEKNSCGCVACLGGWLYFTQFGKEIRAPGDTKFPSNVMEEMDGYVRYNSSESLHELFFPDDLYFGWHLITPEMAADAIDNFLNFGNPKWEQATKSLYDDEREYDEE